MGYKRGYVLEGYSEDLIVIGGTDSDGNVVTG